MTVSIPRLEFWPFVLEVGDEGPLKFFSFQFPGWNSGRLCNPEVTSSAMFNPVSIPRLEFWPFVPGAGGAAGCRFLGFQFPGWNSGRLCCTGCTELGVGYAFQFPGWNSGRLCL